MEFFIKIVATALIGLNINTASFTGFVTQITKEGDFYFMVNPSRESHVYYTTKLNKTAWFEFPYEDFAKGHSVTYAWGLYIFDDTENHQLLAFRWENGFILHQALPTNGLRPHHVEYDPITDKVYVLNSGDGEIVEIGFENNAMFISNTHTFEFLLPYSRSFTLVDGHMYLYGGDGVLEVDYQNDWGIIREWEMSEGIGAQTVFYPYLGGYLLAYTFGYNKFCDNWGDEVTECKDVSEELNISNTLYSITEFDGQLWGTSIFYGKPEVINLTKKEKYIIFKER